MKKITYLSFVMLLFIYSCGQQNKTENVELPEKNNPYNYPYNNPVVTHMYTADAAPKVMPDGRLWMVTSVDHEDGGGYATMHAIHAYSTSDMITWTDHGEILGIDDMSQPEGEDWAIWAPDIIYHQGKYWLYFPMRNLLEDGTIDRYVAVATSDRMDQRFTLVQPRMQSVPKAGLDPSVFIDDDGVAYLYYNQSLMGVLDETMLELEGEPFKLDYGAKNFMEAAWMHKRNGKYYYNYHTKYNRHVSKENPDDSERKKSELHYSMGDSPTGPLTHMGVINYELGYGVTGGPKYPGYDFVPWRLCQSNHGAVVEYHGQEYFFYHTSALSSWRQTQFKDRGSWTQRSVCVDSLNYNEDGTVIPVQQTLGGVGKVVIDQPFSIELDKKEIIAEGGKVLEFKGIDMGTGYYYFGTDIIETVAKGKIEVRKSSADGTLMGTILINDRSTEINSGRAETFLREAHGVEDVYVKVIIEEGEALKIANLELFAGSPKALD